MKGNRLSRTERISLLTLAAVTIVFVGGGAMLDRLLNKAPDVSAIEEIKIEKGAGRDTVSVVSSSLDGKSKESAGKKDKQKKPGRKKKSANKKEKTPPAPPRNPLDREM